jgi:uncharacterized protein (DUF362 family)
MMTNLKRYLSRYWFKLTFFGLGIGSLIWFLIRVIPKPSRVNYPCIRTAAPLASTFIAYLMGISLSTLVLKLARKRFQKSKYIVAGLFAVLGMLIGFWTIAHNTNSVNANTVLQGPQAGNEPIGEGKGVFPGRVVWEYNPEATNEDMTNESGDYWSMDKNANQGVINAMLSSGIQNLTGTSTDAAAWDSIFHYYNRTHGKGNVGYQTGEKIVIKINLNGMGNTYTSTPPKNINTSPQVCYALLDQLVNVAGVAQSNICIGDVNVTMNTVTWDKCHSVFSNVKYWGNGAGQRAVAQSTNKELKSSDHGSANKYEDYIPKDYVDAAYMINMPVFKKHHRAGISISSKNHFGSMAVFTGGAWHLHYSLPCPDATGEAVNGDYGVYRCFVDIMGHKDLGGKTILYLVDGIWGSVNWGHPPVKWRMTPFNDDWPSSLFISQDPVAIESVCFDFLYKEFDETHPTEGVFVGDDKGPFPHFAGTDDFLHQAADTTNWPAGISYDPENDGSHLKSMGTHEHWNNDIDKQYSRNLSNTGKGIELLRVTGATPVEIVTTKLSGVKIKSGYPNPFTDKTTISYNLESSSIVRIDIYNTNGQLVKTVQNQNNEIGQNEFVWDGTNNSGVKVAIGNYYFRISIINESGNIVESQKLQLID